jgi:hypothetical protein
MNAMSSRAWPVLASALWLCVVPSARALEPAAPAPVRPEPVRVVPNVSPTAETPATPPLPAEPPVAAPTEPTTPPEGPPETTATTAPTEADPSEATPTPAEQPVGEVLPRTAPAAAAATPEEAKYTRSGRKIRTKRKYDRPRFPKLVVAGGPVIGPHAIGNELCRASDQVCEKHGAFFGVGGQVEVRARLYQALAFHARGLVVANSMAADKDPIYDGMWGAGAGLGAYGRRIFGRIEYVFVDAWGKNTFKPPLHSEETGKDEWGHHAGLISAGARFPFRQRLAMELWGGFMFGPKSVRTVPPNPPETRILPTFLFGLSFAVDVIP